MDSNMSLFTQINSLCYWFQKETSYYCVMMLDSEQDSYHIQLKDDHSQIYAQQVSYFSTKSNELLEIELSSIAQSLVLIKRLYIENRKLVSQAV